MITRRQFIQSIAVAGATASLPVLANPVWDTFITRPPEGIVTLGNHVTADRTVQWLDGGDVSHPPSWASAIPEYGHARKSPMSGEPLIGMALFVVPSPHGSIHIKGANIVIPAWDVSIASVFQAWRTVMADDKLRIDFTVRI